jgi:hypothetical protein
VGTAINKWDSTVSNHRAGWIDVLSRGDAEVLWTKLFYIVSRHSAIRSLYSPSKWSQQSLREVHADLTQDLFLRLHEKGRWQFYLDAGYTDERVERELYRLEIPNLVSQLLRERYPESYRIVRRVSTLLMTKDEFRCFHKLVNPSQSSGRLVMTRPSKKMVLQVYGLSTWPLDKPLNQEQNLQELVKEVAPRMRDIRRAGRGSTSHVIISNEELTLLIIDIFKTIDTPADVRTIRSLVLTKLAIEDSQEIPIDGGAPSSASETEVARMDLVDCRPTPEEEVLEKEMAWRIGLLVEAILKRCFEMVRSKPQRFRKLVEVVWHCYFNASSSCQSNVAKLMGISDSLVSHYRKIFDTVVRSEQLSVDECLLLNGALNKRLSAIMAEYEANDSKNGRAKTNKPRAVKPPYEIHPNYRTAAASKRG